MTTTNGFGTYWNQIPAWDNGANPSAGNTYVVPNTFRVRSQENFLPATDNINIFPGDSLTINGGGDFRAKGNFTVANLILNGGSVNNGNRAGSAPFNFEWAGATTVAAASTIDLSGAPAATFDRFFTITSTLSGNGALSLTNGGGAITLANLATAGGIALTNAANSFTGAWNVQSGVLRGTAANSLGSGSITVATLGGLDFDYAYNQPAATLLLGGFMALDQNIIVGALTVSGTAFAPGTYNYGAFTAAGKSGNFTNGSGTITVVPESGSIALLAAASLITLRRRRSSRVTN